MPSTSKSYLGAAGTQQLVELIHDNSDNISTLAEIATGLAATKADISDLDDAYERTVAITTPAQLQTLVRSGRHLKKLRYGDMIVVNTVSGRSSLSSLRFRVIGLDHDIPSDQTKTHSLTLKCIEPIFPKIFNEEAFIIFQQATAAGLYSVALPAMNHLYVGGDQFNIDLTAQAAGTVLTFKKQKVLGTVRMTQYSTKASNAQSWTDSGYGKLEIVNSADYESGTAPTSLGTAGSTTGINAFGRAAMGGGVYSKSDLREWLNSNDPSATLSANWTNKGNSFALKPTSFDHGFLYLLDPDFVAVLGNVKKTTIEYDVGNTATVRVTDEKAFVESYAEVTGRTNPHAVVQNAGEEDIILTEGSRYGYYNIFSDTMYDDDGNPKNQLLRTCSPTDLTAIVYGMDASYDYEDVNRSYAFPCVCVV